MAKQEFTIKRAIQVQTEQLKKWKQVLKSEVFSELEKWATEKNHLKVDPYKIIRGSYLTTFVVNYSNDYKPQN